jgi:hypothetical protein
VTPQMKMRIKRWFLRWLEVVIDRLSHWQAENDTCEVCQKFTADRECIGCDRRYCHDCESGYYEDADLCTLCRADITPEQEAEDRIANSEDWVTPEK